MKFILRKYSQILVIGILICLFAPNIQAGSITPDPYPYNVSEYHVLMIDHSGSMFQNYDDSGENRFSRAIDSAKADVQGVISDGDSIAVAYFDCPLGNCAVVVVQDFTDDKQAVLDALDLIPSNQGGGTTNLADAMCFGTTLLTTKTGGRHLYTYTDGYECASNCSDADICDACDIDCGTQWYYNCDPSGPTNCSAWQMCVAGSITAETVVMVRYFGETITKSGPVDYSNMTETTVQGTPDMVFLRYMAEISGGEFNFIPDESTNEIFTNGDVDCNGTINILDVTYILYYLYKGGPIPCSF